MILPKRVLNRIGRPFGVNPFPRAFNNPIEGQAKSASEIFDEIHRVNYWGSGESVSGVGSERSFTRNYLTGFSKALNKYRIQSIFDAPCGDLNWMSSFLKDHPLAYSGGDISQEVIARVHAEHPEREVRIFDITTDTFPDADLWHCRDCLFHLPFDATNQALENFASSHIKYALITSHRSRLLHCNLDVGFGGFRFLDLERAPFYLPLPLFRIADYRKGSDFPRFVCLWTREQIAHSLLSKAGNL